MSGGTITADSRRTAAGPRSPWATPQQGARQRSRRPSLRSLPRTTPARRQHDHFIAVARRPRIRPATRVARWAVRCGPGDRRYQHLVACSTLPCRTSGVPAMRWAIAPTAQRPRSRPLQLWRRPVETCAFYLFATICATMRSRSSWINPVVSIDLLSESIYVPTRYTPNLSSYLDAPVQADNLD